MKSFLNKFEKFNLKKIINTESKFSNFIDSKIFNFKSIDNILSNTNKDHTNLFNKEKKSVKNIIADKKDKMFYNNFSKNLSYSTNGNKNNLVSLNKSDFENGKFKVVSARSYNKFEPVLYWSIQILNYFLIYKTISRFVTLKFIRGCFYLFLTALVSRFNMSYTTKRKMFIKSITLYDCGKRVKVETLQENLLLDISSFREFDTDEKRHVSQFFLGKNFNFMPMIINNEIYVLTQKCIMQNKEVFMSIKNGNYIDIIDDKNDSDDDFNNKKKRKENIIIDI